MKTHLLIPALLGMLALSGCGEWPGKPQVSIAAAPGTEAGFQSMYALQCAACHGDSGRSGAARPLNDPLYLSITPKSEFSQAVGHGQGILMPGYLKEEGGPWQPDILADFVDDLYLAWGDDLAHQGEQLPAHDIGNGDAARGAASFATWCGACHGADGAGLKSEPTGEGVVDGHSVVDQDYLRLISDRGLRSAVVFGHPEYKMPSYRGPFPGQGDRMMDEQAIDDITAWLISQRVTVTQQATKGAADD